MNFSSWKKSLSDAVTTAAGAASAAVSKAAEVAKDVADDSYAIAIGAKCLRDYRMGQHVSTGGPHNVWKVYSAANRNPGIPRIPGLKESATRGAPGCNITDH
jgi:hypothetical protein